MKEKKISKLNITFIILDILALGVIFLAYGPISYFRNLLVTTAMTTMSHHYLARTIYTDKMISYTLSNNYVSEGKQNTNTSDIIIDNEDDGNYESIYEEQILKRDPDNDLYKVIPIDENGYKGYLVAIYDPSRVGIATTRYLGVRGEAIDNVAKRYGAVVAMNAGGFYDPDWNSNGALPHGIVIENGKVVSEYAKANVGGGMVGFTNDNKLVLGKFSKSEALNMGIRDAVEFGPFLIINGEASKVLGNGGWGIAPRTAIGQRQDGIVLFLVINGRIPTSIGADMNDLIEIMQKYGAYNAANMDGGSSTELVINNKIINKPVAGGRDGLRDMPTFWIVK